MLGAELAAPIALLVGGHAALVVCTALYLAWWRLFFDPRRDKPRGSQFAAGVGCIVGAAVLGVAGVALCVVGMTGLLPVEIRGAALGGMAGCGLALYVVLLMGTVKLFKRPVTTELLLFTAWAVLELGVLNVAFATSVLAAPTAIVLGVLVAAVLLASLASYLLYYRLEPQRAYAAGAVPLAAVGVLAAAMAVALVL